MANISSKKENQNEVLKDIILRDEENLCDAKVTKDEISFLGFLL